MAVMLAETGDAGASKTSRNLREEIANAQKTVSSLTTDPLVNDMVKSVNKDLTGTNTSKNSNVRNLKDEIAYTEQLVKDDAMAKSVMDGATNSVVKDLNNYYGYTPATKDNSQIGNGSGGNNGSGNNSNDNNNVNNYLASGNASAIAEQIAALQNNNQTTSSASSYLQQAYDKLLADYDTQVEAIKSGYANIEDQRKQAAAAAIEQARLQLENSYNQAVSGYQNQQNEIDYLKKVNADNLILANTAAGNLGGIGQAQYSAQQAEYDNQMLTIKLEQINLKANLDSEIAQLEAEGEYELANQLAELGVAQLQDLQTQYNNLAQMSYNYANALDSNAITNRQLDFNEAMSLLQQGVVSANSAAALGLTTEQAQQIANYYKSAQDLDLATAKANLTSSYLSGDGYSSGGSGSAVADGDTYTASDGSTYVYDSNSGGYVLQSAGTLTSGNTNTKANAYPSEKAVSSLASSNGAKLNYNERETMMDASMGMTDAEVNAAKQLYDTAGSSYASNGRATTIPGLSKAYSKFQSSSTYNRDGALSTNGLTQYLSLYNITNGDPVAMATNAEVLARQGAIDSDDLATILYICDIGSQLK